MLVAPTERHHVAARHEVVAYLDPPVPVPQTDVAVTPETGCRHADRGTEVHDQALPTRVEGPLVPGPPQGPAELPGYERKARRPRGELDHADAVRQHHRT